LDYVFTSEHNLIDHVTYDAPLGKSDHVVLKWKLLLKVHDLPSNQRKFNYFSGNYKVIQHNLGMINWKERWNGKSLPEMWTDFKTTDGPSQSPYPT